MLNLSEVLSALASVKGVTLAEITYRQPLNVKARQSGAVTRQIVKLGEAFESVYTADIAKLQDMALDGLDNTARNEIVESLQESLQQGIGHNSRYTCQDTYTAVEGIPGVSVHKETGSLYVVGLSLSREVLQAGVTLPEVNSKPLTIAKNKLRAVLASGKIRRLSLKQIESIGIFQNTLQVVASGE
jgi:hypothetical protein